MASILKMRADRFVVCFAVCALAACGPSDDKSKDKKVEPAAPPKVETKPAPKAETKPAPQAKDDTAGWVLLGQQQADRKTDKDRIVVGANDGRFKELRITVKGGPVTIDEMIVTFGKGKEFRPKIQHQFSEKDSSKVIDLPGDKRVIRHVDFVYRTAAARGEGKATVMLYAR